LVQRVPVAGLDELLEGAQDETAEARRPREIVDRDALRDQPLEDLTLLGRIVIRRPVNTHGGKPRELLLGHREPSCREAAPATSRRVSQPWLVRIDTQDTAAGPPRL